MPEGGFGIHSREVIRMQADALLPGEIRPEFVYTGAVPRTALLTGACGFLGRYVVRELLSRTNLRLVCLVREKGGEPATARTIRVLSEIGISKEDLGSRVEVLVGDVSEPNLGVGNEVFAELAERIDVIYHCAAKVDWVRGYGHLYRMNVGGVLAMIRLACKGPTKRLVFVSSMAQCFAWDGPEQVDEETDMLPFIGGMPLGYARSKCVAEALLKQAAERGVPVTVLRPSLIAGDSVSGVSNPRDLIAALIEASVATGLAIDADWLVDCVPVDFVARVIAAVPQGSSNWQPLNLRHERPRHWRELILWMNLHGYSVKLVERDTWVRHLFEEQGARGTQLYAQRQFFVGKSPKWGEAKRPAPFVTYLAPCQHRIDTRLTRAKLTSLGIDQAPMNADLLHAYFDDYRRIGLLPARKTGDEPSPAIESLLAARWLSRGSQTDTRRWVPDELSLIGSDDGLLSEIAAARIKDSVGIRRLRVRDVSKDVPAHVDVVLKVKGSDSLLKEQTVRMASVCRPELGELLERYVNCLGLHQSQERELALYEMDDPRLLSHMPTCYGTLRDSEAGRWALLLEYLPETESRAKLWHISADDEQVQAILNGMAQIHSVWYRREEELARQPWLTPPPDTEGMSQITPLWRELADFSRPWFETWCGPSVSNMQREMIASLDQWWGRLGALPATLIHNDFNPRNFVVRESNGESRLCVYDWELATLGIPQHDLAELLCFTWHGGLTKRDLDNLLDTYRSTLSEASGTQIDPVEWREGFELALRHLLIERLPLYTLMNRFRPLEYLPRVMTNWMRLQAWA